MARTHKKAHNLGGASKISMKTHWHGCLCLLCVHVPHPLGAILKSQYQHRRPQLQGVHFIEIHQLFIWLKYNFVPCKMQVNMIVMYDVVSLISTHLSLSSMYMKPSFWDMHSSIHAWGNSHTLLASQHDIPM